MLFLGLFGRYLLIYTSLSTLTNKLWHIVGKLWITHFFWDCALECREDFRPHLNTIRGKHNISPDKFCGLALSALNNEKPGNCWLWPIRRRQRRPPAQNNKNKTPLLLLEQTLSKCVASLSIVGRFARTLTSNHGNILWWNFFHTALWLDPHFDPHLMLRRSLSTEYELILQSGNW